MRKVTGASAESVAAGVGGILDALYGSARPPAGISILFAPECVGAIIGKGGAAIKALRTTTGAEIKANLSPLLLGSTFSFRISPLSFLPSHSGCTVLLRFVRSCLQVQDDSVRVLGTYARCDVSGDPLKVRAATQQLSLTLFEQVGVGARHEPLLTALSTLPE